MGALAFVDAAALRGALTDAEAMEAIGAALRLSSFEPERETPRSVAPVSAGELLLMPSELGAFAGVKVATVAPRNPSLGRPRIQGVYLLMDAPTLTPLATFDAAELTLLRTPAVTSFAVSALLAARSRRTVPTVKRLVVIGTGPQAERHIRSLTSVLEVADVSIVGRRPSAVTALVDSLAASGIACRAAGTDDLRHADVVVCATSSTTPVFAADALAPDVIVAAVGAHGLASREVPADFARRAQVVVESIESALREAGDLVPARSAADWRSRGLLTLRDLALGLGLGLGLGEAAAPEAPAAAWSPTGIHSLPASQGPVLYTGVGMAWQDLAVVARAWGGLTRLTP